MSDFEGKVALLTGATSGIGLAAAERLSALGATVIASGLEREVDSLRADWAARGIAGTVEAVDVRDENSVAALVERVASASGGIDILVTAAGIQRYGSAAETSSTVWDDVFAVNVRGAFYAIKHVVPHQRARGGGSIVVVSSVQAFITQTGVAAYTASKGALNALVRSVAVDEAANGIRANTVCPGSVDTPMLRTSAREFSDGTAAGEQATIDSWGTMHPLGRVAQPSEIADVIAFLAGPRSSFVTGAAIPVDGGLLASAPVVLPE
jgi:NAD(P)-dependent dehydrogenase (short-subunit alcohol dehydrogenase family)